MTLQWKKGHSIKIGGAIGVGTFGEVRFGRVVETGLNVAVKIVDLARLEDSVSSSMVKKEIACLKRLHHKNVIRILDIKSKTPYRGTWCQHCACTNLHLHVEGSHCAQCHHDASDHSEEQVRNVLLMIEELGSGGELFGILMHCGPFREDVARFYFTQIIEGLSYIHSKNIYHRDLKPENIVLDHHFELKMIDFGLAAFLSKNSSRKLHSGVGSSSYSAPEVFYARELFEGIGYHGGPADIWSAGVILFVMLTGRPPFVRPLVTSHFEAGLKKDKRFVRLLKGDGYEGISPAARQLLMSIFRIDPKTRPTFEEIKRSRWYNQALPTKEDLFSHMSQRSKLLWSQVEKPWMFSILRQMQAEVLPTKYLDVLNTESNEEEDDEDEDEDDDEDDDEGEDEDKNVGVDFDGQILSNSSTTMDARDKRTSKRMNAFHGGSHPSKDSFLDESNSCNHCHEHHAVKPEDHQENVLKLQNLHLRDSSSSYFEPTSSRGLCGGSCCSSHHSLQPISRASSPNAHSQQDSKKQDANTFDCSSFYSVSSSNPAFQSQFRELSFKGDFFKVLTLLEINLSRCGYTSEIRQPSPAEMSVQPSLRSSMVVQSLDQALHQQSFQALINVLFNEKSQMITVNFRLVQGSSIILVSLIDALATALHHKP